jgi:hypothetical protein
VDVQNNMTNQMLLAHCQVEKGRAYRKYGDNHWKTALYDTVINLDNIVAALK